MKIVTIGRGNVGGGLAALWRARPSSLYAADGAADATAGRLITDASYDPVRVGGLDKARALEDLTWLLSAAAPGQCPLLLPLRGARPAVK